MKVLYIGASGSLGERYLESETGSQSYCDVLVRSSRSLAVLSRFGNKRIAAPPLADQPAWDSLVGNYNIVIYAANEGSLTNAMALFSALVTSIEKTHARLIFFSSAIALTGVVKFNSSNVISGGYHWNSYAHAKIQMEKRLSRVCISSKFVVLRPGLIWGPGMPWLARLSSLVRGRTCHLYGDLGIRANLVEYDELIQVLESKIRAVRFTNSAENTTGSRSISWKNLFQELAEICQGCVSLHTGPAPISISSKIRQWVVSAPLSNRVKYSLTPQQKDFAKSAALSLGLLSRAHPDPAGSLFPGNLEEVDVASRPFNLNQRLQESEPHEGVSRASRVWLIESGYATD